MLVYQRVRVESGRFFWIQTWRRDSMCTTADLLVYDTAFILDCETRLGDLMWHRCSPSRPQENNEGSGIRVIEDERYER